jgi:hypothetical protein
MKNMSSQSQIVITSVQLEICGSAVVEPSSHPTDVKGLSPTATAYTMKKYDERD